MIRIIYPKPGEVSRMGGLQLLEVEADTEAEIVALTSRIDDGVQVFIAAPGSIAHTPDHSADWEFGPASTWVKRGGRGGGSAAPGAILPETTFEVADGAFYITTPLSGTPEVGTVYTVAHNGTPYACPAIPYVEEGLTGVMLGNTDALGEPGGNPDAPFAMLLTPSGSDMDGAVIYGRVIDMSGAASVTLEIKRQGDNGPSVLEVSVKYNTFDETSGHDFGPFSKTIEEMLGAFAAGKHIRIRASMEFGGMTHYLYGDVCGARVADEGVGLVARVPKTIDYAEYALYLLASDGSGGMFVFYLDE